MKVTFHGSSAVDIAGHDGVEPGATVEVSDEVGEQLLLAGSSIDADGRVTPPAQPLWSRASGGKPPKPATDSAPVQADPAAIEGN